MNYEFLILMDFSRSNYNALIYIIDLVKAIGGSIEIHSIIDPTSIGDSENNLIAKRALNSIQKTTVNKLNSLKEIIAVEKIDVKKSYSIGHFETELKNKLDSSRHKIVVVDRNKFSTLGKMSKILINNFDGYVLIINDDSKFLSGDKIIIENNGKALEQLKFAFVSSLSQLKQLPIVISDIQIDKKIIEHTNSSPNMKGELDRYLNKKKGTNSINESIDHSPSTNIELLCIERNYLKKSLYNGFFNRNKKIIKIIKKIQNPLLIMAN